jgi:hypothetical protein
MRKYEKDSPFQANDLLLHADDILFEEQEQGDAYIYNKNTGRIVKLNQIAFFVLKLCNGTHYSIAKKAFLREFDLQDKVGSCTSNFTETLRLLLEKELVQVVKQDSPEKNLLR